jgi:hypothetical protein
MNHFEVSVVSTFKNKVDNSLTMVIVGSLGEFRRNIGSNITRPQ